MTEPSQHEQLAEDVDVAAATADTVQSPPAPDKKTSSKRIKWINRELERMATLKRPLNSGEMRRVSGIIAETRALAKQDDNPEFRRLYKVAKLVRSTKAPRQPGAAPPQPIGLEAVLPAGLVRSRQLRLAQREVQGGLPGSGRGS